MPRAHLYYAKLFDEVWCQKLKSNINSAWQTELKNKMSTWQNLWDHDGNLLLKTSIEIVGKPYPDTSYKVALTLSSMPSISAPLIVNSRYALNSFTKTPIKNDVFISTIFHELLHNYLDAILPQRSPLLDKYQAETKGVVNHLHLFALEKAVYLKLGWQAKLKDVIAKDQSLPNGDYKRAWEIVNHTEDYLNFIGELKLLSNNV